MLEWLSLLFDSLTLFMYVVIFIHIKDFIVQCFKCLKTYHQLIILKNNSFKGKFK